MSRLNAIAGRAVEPQRPRPQCPKCQDYGFTIQGAPYPECERDMFVSQIYDVAVSCPDCPEGEWFMAQRLEWLKPILPSQRSVMLPPRRHVPAAVCEIPGSAGK